MKKGIYIGSLPGESAEERFRNAAECGFESVEVSTLRNEAERREVKEISERYGVRPAGQWVAEGQVIGLCGSTGHSTGPHLHFEVIRGGVRRNPLLYLP